LRRVRRRISFQPLLWPMEQVIKCLRSIERDPQKWKPVLPGQNAFVRPEIALQSFERAHDLFAKPLTLRRIMRYGTASIQSYKVFARFLKCTQSRVLSIGEFGARALGVCRLNHDRRGKQDESSCSKDRRRTETCRQPLSQSADSHCYLDRSSICLAYARARAHAH
jgi:hypothetical protein